MKFFEFFDKSKFEFLARGVSNWDYYKMQYQDGDPAVVAIAKPGTGSKDCFFGSLKYYYQKQPRQAGEMEYEQ